MSPYNPTALSSLKVGPQALQGPIICSESLKYISGVPRVSQFGDTLNAVYQLNLFSLATSCSTDKRRACLFAETGNSRGGMS